MRAMAVLAVTAMALGIAATTFAQGPCGSGADKEGMGPGHHKMMGAAWSNAMEKLNLTDEQKSKVNGIHEDCMAQMKAMHEQCMKKMEEVLTPDQMKQLKEEMPWSRMMKSCGGGEGMKEGEREKEGGSSTTEPEPGSSGMTGGETP